METDEIIKGLHDAENNSELDCEINELRPVLKEAADTIEYLQKELIDYNHLQKIVDGQMSQNARLRRINEGLQNQLKAAKEDLKHWKICGTCGNFKNGNCTFPKQNWKNANYVGCKMWQWRGEAENNVEQHETVVSLMIKRCKD